LLLLLSGFVLFCAENKAASPLGSALGLSGLKPRNSAWSWRKSSEMKLR